MPRKFSSVLAAQIEISVDDGLDGIDDLFVGETGAGNLADGAGFVSRAAERELIGFGAFALEAENADMADMVMAAGIDAAGNLDFQVADIARPRAVAEAFGDGLRDRDRARGRERAIIEARAGDDVGDEPGIGGGETVRGKAS